MMTELAVLSVYVVIGVVFATIAIRKLKPDEPIFAGVLWAMAVFTWPMFLGMLLLNLIGVLLTLRTKG